MEYKKLNNGVEIPLLGLGTYRMTAQNEVLKALDTAFQVGYRLIDTADIYGNHHQIGLALEKLGIDRHEIFLTTKIWNTDHGYKNVFNVFDRFLNELRTDYIDLLLIHWPGPYRSYVETWQAMIELQKDGKIRAIGVSNFLQNHLRDIINETNVVPAVNQIELHPYLVDWQLVEFCQKNQIAVESWAPILKGTIASDPVLNQIGAHYGKTAVQVTLRWHIQHGFIAIPKSSNPERIKENFQIWDFELSQQDMQKIDQLNRNYRRGPDPKTFF